MTDIRKEYFEWLYEIVSHGRYDKDVSYRKLLSYLHLREFVYYIPRDKNRAMDGVELRHSFIGHDDHITEMSPESCSVLEMLVALAIRCENSIMNDPSKGDRTQQWFWLMINNLGLGGMMDDLYDEKNASMIIDRFIKREYSPNGKGGLFYIKNCDRDLRDVEIWFQLCWYLNSII